MRCDLGRASIDYETFGEGVPLVVLHGMPLDRNASIFEFEPVLSTRAGWRRIYPDLPGHGRSPGAAAITTPDQLLDVLVEFVEALLGGARFVAAGTSFGAYLARARPPPGQQDRRPVPQRSAHRARSGGGPAPRLIVADEARIDEQSRDPGWAWYGEMAVADSVVNRAYARADNSTTSDAAYLAQLHGAATPCSFETEDLPEPFAPPTLILTGRQDNVVGFKAVWEILPSYPRATFAVLDRAGHLLRGEQPALFSALVNEWLDRVEEWMDAGVATSVDA